MNEFGKGADVVGIIVDENGQTVSAFEKLSYGYGSIWTETWTWTPVLSQNYATPGIAEAYPLPTIKGRTGFVHRNQGMTQR